MIKNNLDFLFKIIYRLIYDNDVNIKYIKLNLYIYLFIIESAYKERQRANNFLNQTFLILYKIKT